MAVFFLVVGLEVKRELVYGELRDRRRVALPVIAAAGGMVVPAAIYLAVTAGQPGGRGWAIPMPTDIAFVLGVVVLLGPRVPTSLKLFLLMLGIADDIASALVLAVGYSAGVSWAGIVSVVGVAAGLCVPARVAARVEHVLHPWSSFVVVPLFALANAGVHLAGHEVTSRVAVAIVVARVVGKPAGIVAFAWLARRLGLARLPDGVSWRQLTGAGALAGLPFTVSLVIVPLALD